MYQLLVYSHIIFSNEYEKAKKHIFGSYSFFFLLCLVDLVQLNS